MGSCKGLVVINNWNCGDVKLSPTTIPICQFTYKQNMYWNNVNPKQTFAISISPQTVIHPPPTQILLQIKLRIAQSTLTQGNSFTRVEHHNPMFICLFSNMYIAYCETVVHYYTGRLGLACLAGCSHRALVSL